MGYIKKETFGLSHSGVPVAIYTLSDEVIRVRVMTMGGTIVSIEAPDREWHMDDVCPVSYTHLDVYKRQQ